MIFAGIPNFLNAASPAFNMINSTILDSSSVANVQGKYVYDLLLFSLLDGSNYRLSVLIDQNSQPGAGLLIVGT